MFPPLPYDEKAREAYCQRVWGVKVRPEWTAMQFWGRNILSSSNIVFSNGLLDPWHRGGPLTNLTDTIVSVLIEDGAHHLDLRGSNPADPESVKRARLAEIEQISQWINKARSI
jgi:hypothetical protein